MTSRSNCAKERTIAHWVPASGQILDDAPMLMSVINAQLQYGLADVEENQLLSGSNTGEDLNWYLTQATAFSAPIVPSELASNTKIDAQARRPLGGADRTRMC